ncbi:MAG: hypothetical protein ACKO2L_06245 [Planctomycetaceae bacterium]
MASANAGTEGEPGSLSILLRQATNGDQNAGNELLRRLQSDYADRLTANLQSLQAADRDAIASDMLYRLYKGLINGRFTQARNRGDLFKLIGASTTDVAKKTGEKKTPTKLAFCSPDLSPNTNSHQPNPLPMNSPKWKTSSGTCPLASIATSKTVPKRHTSDQCSP